MALPIDPNKKKNPEKEANTVKPLGTNNAEKKTVEKKAAKKPNEKSFKTSEKKLTAADVKKKRERNKKLGIAGGSVAVLAALGITAGMIINYEAPAGETNNGNGGTNGVSDNGAPTLNEANNDADYIDHGLEIPIDTADYLSTHRLGIEGGLTDYEETDYSASYELPEDSVSGNAGEENPEDSDTTGGYGHSWNYEEVDPNDFSWNNSDARYYIEQTQRELVQDISFAFPSRAAGFTNNPEHYTLEGGSYNPMYSYVLAEDVEYFFGHHLQRLLNPLYGGWWHAQLGNDFESRTVNAGEFVDMFTESYWEDNIVEGDVSNLPIYADWDGDNFGGRELTDGPRWFGEIESMENSVNEDTITSVIEVEYTSFNANGGRENSNGTLELTIVPNPDEGASVNNRLVISEASLTIND